MSNNNCYYATLDGERTGRASHFFKLEDSAKMDAKARNQKVQAMNLTGRGFRYSVATTPVNTIKPGDKLR